MAKLLGDYPLIERVQTGLWSLDLALSNDREVGWPMTTYEVSGFTGIGKTTFASSILGLISAKLEKDLVYAPIEPIDRNLLSDILDSVGFEQRAHIISEKTDEEIIDKFCELLMDDKIATGVFDSLSAISPISEMESSSADINMARRARLGGILARKLVHLNRFRTSPSTSIIISHITTDMGKPTNTGSPTTGGESKKNLSKARIRLKKLQEPTMFEQDKNAFVLEGVVEKFNFGRDKRKFYSVILGGKGIHLGMSAMYDCKMLKLCSFGRSITLGKEKYGSMKSILEKAHAGDDKFFEPFIEALKNPSKVGKAEVDEQDSIGYMEEEPE